MNEIEQENMDRDENEERSEEVQVIIDRMPTQGTTYVAFIIIMLISIIFTIGYLVRYHDTVDGQISITALNAPVRLISNSNGRLHLLHEDGTAITKGTVISFIDNPADYHNVCMVDSIINSCDITKIAGIPLNEQLELGELSPAYSNFYVAHKHYHYFISSNTYEIRRNSLRSQIEMDTKILGNIQNEISVRNEILKISAEQLFKDSIIFSQKAMSEADYVRQKAEHLASIETYQRLQTELSSIQSRIKKNTIDIGQLDAEENENAHRLWLELITNKNELINHIAVWKQNFVTISPVDGRLEYLDFWRQNSFVQNGQELYSVIPLKNELIGEMMIPSYGSGKVETGQQVNVKLNNYPYDEFGSIRGIVKSISHITNTIKTDQGNVDAYRVIVGFPDGSTTNYGAKLDLNFESKGMAEIITKNKRLIQRLFDNLKYSVTNDEHKKHQIEQ
ncbi:MAG: HlyD family secretion protein [Bacteroidales bacterium]|jgi:hypothetical protein|nr:HlyD family secretion protein [Bacteroidales bacterium]